MTDRAWIGASPMEDELVAAGRYARVLTQRFGSSDGHAATVGFVPDDGRQPDASEAILVAAGSPDAEWAHNLLVEPRCEVVIGERHFEALAEPLAGAEHAGAIRSLILRYGTPAEGLGAGPSFRLVPVEAGADA